jgi:putative endonuclease
MKNNYSVFSAKHQKINFNNSLGQTGETMACKFLKSNKYKILKRNYREKFDEIDIIAKSIDKCLVFIEVKTMSYSNIKSEIMRSPEDNFTSSKFRKIKRICEMFVAKHPDIIEMKIGWRIDLLDIEIYPNLNKILIRHYKKVNK